MSSKGLTVPKEKFVLCLQLLGDPWNVLPAKCVFVCLGALGHSRYSI